MAVYLVHKGKRVGRLWTTAFHIMKAEGDVELLEERYVQGLYGFRLFGTNRVAVYDPQLYYGHIYFRFTPETLYIIEPEETWLKTLDFRVARGGIIVDFDAVKESQFEATLIGGTAGIAVASDGRYLLFGASTINYEKTYELTFKNKGGINKRVVARRIPDFFSEVFNNQIEDLVLINKGTYKTHNVFNEVNMWHAGEFSLSTLLARYILFACTVTRFPFNFDEIKREIQGYRSSLRYYQELDEEKAHVLSAFMTINSFFKKYPDAFTSFLKSHSVRDFYASGHLELKLRKRGLIR